MFVCSEPARRVWSCGLAWSRIFRVSLGSGLGSGKILCSTTPGAGARGAGRPLAALPGQGSAGTNCQQSSEDL
jgi:hypothetical protein